MGRIYTFVNQKGGVGKTTSAINLGAYLGFFNQKVLIIDLDPQANATACLNIDRQVIQGGTYQVLIGAAPPESFILHNPRLKLSILPASAELAGAEIELVSEMARESKLRRAMRNLADKYDYILIDCPPSLGLLTLNGLVAAKDGLIIPVQCEYLALEGWGALWIPSVVCARLYSRSCQFGASCSLCSIAVPTLQAKLPKRSNGFFPTTSFRPSFRAAFV